MELKDDAGRFESGLPNAPGIAGLNASLGLMERTGFENVYRQAWEVSGYFIERLAELGAELAPCTRSDRTRSTIVSFRMGDTQALYQALRERQMACSYRCGYIRTGIHGYNTVEEADRFLDALKSLRP